MARSPGNLCDSAELTCTALDARARLLLLHIRLHAVANGLLHGGSGACGVNCAPPCGANRQETQGCRNGKDRVCECAPTFVENEAGVCVKDNCLLVDCHNGTCINLPNSYQCECDEGYQGQHCDDSDLCPGLDCTPGTCFFNANGEPICDCPTDFFAPPRADYTSCEPCPMCLSAIWWARIETIFFASDRDDAARIGFDDAALYQEVSLELPDRQLPLIRHPLAAADQLMEDWLKKEDKIPY